MAQITIDIPADKLPRVLSAVEGLWPIPETDGVPDHTAAEWAKAKLIGWIRTTVHRWECKAAQTGVVPDEDIAS
jgi:hypothetical protein